MKIGEGTDSEECARCIAYGSLKLENPIKNSHPVGTSLSKPYQASPCENPYTKESTSEFSVETTVSSFTKDVDKKETIKTIKQNRISKTSEISSDTISKEIKNQSFGASNIRTEELLTYKTDTEEISYEKIQTLQILI